MLAKALYDNAAEAEEEISFHRGDVVTVLQLDPNGLEGWWLCSFKGRIGIAPGNRLKHLSGTEPETEVQMREKTSVIGEKRTSYVYDPSKVITPSNIGGVFVYNETNPDQPIPQDYDIPRSTAQVTKPQFTHSLYDTPSKSKPGLYDNPKSSHTSHIKTIEDLYDKPSNRRHVLAQLGVQSETHSNRSSGISMLSSVSGISASNQSIHSADSAPSSVRSSIDASHDPYDIPQRAKTLTRMPLRKTKPSDNILDSLDMYDSPQKVVRPVKEIHLPAERFGGGDYCEIQEGSKDTHRYTGRVSSKPELPYHKNKEHALDDLEMYNTPKRISTKDDVQPAGRVKGYQIRGHVEKSGIYDVPPRVTRDSPIQESPSNARFSGGIADTKGPDLAGVSYSELALERDAAVELLVKLQEDLQKAISKLFYFVSSTWRKRENLQPKMFDVKIACIAVRTALQELVEFGQGALANAVKLEDKRLAKKLHTYLEPVQQTFTKICHCMAGLDSIKWDINRLSTEVPDSTIIDDDLNRIVRETKGLTISFVQLGSFIKGNAPSLFEKNDHLNEPVHDVIGGSSAPKPKPKPPPPIKPKPSLGSADNRDGIAGSRTPSIQGRPLPTPPPRQKELPPVPVSIHSTPPPQGNAAGKVPMSTTQESNTKNMAPPSSGPPVATYGNDYDIPKTRQERMELEEMTRRQQVSSVVTAEETNESKIYDNAKPPRLPSEDYDQIVDQEYDYVALTPEQMKNSLAFKYSQLPSGDYDSPKSHAVGNYDTPSTTVTKVYESSGRGDLSDYDSPNSSRSLDLYDSPQNNSQVRLGHNTSFSQSVDLDMTGQLEGMEVPEVRTSGLSEKFQEKLLNLQKEAESKVLVQGDRVSGASGDTLAAYRRHSQISETDKQVLLFYTNQLESHYAVLVNAMETLFQAVDYNQPPKVFITNSKFVILAAHKLVYISDTITRNIGNKDVGQGIMLGANLLCDALKETVNATKRAALEFPSVVASQEMVDRVVDISHAAGALKAAIVQPVAT